MPDSTTASPYKDLSEENEKKSSGDEVQDGSDGEYLEEYSVAEKEGEVETKLSDLSRNASQAEVFRVLSDEGVRQFPKSSGNTELDLTFRKSLADDMREGDADTKKRNDTINELILQKEFSATKEAKEKTGESNTNDNA